MSVNVQVVLDTTQYMAWLVVTTVAGPAMVFDVVAALDQVVVAVLL